MSTISCMRNIVYLGQLIRQANTFYGRNLPGVVLWPEPRRNTQERYSRINAKDTVLFVEEFLPSNRQPPQWARVCSGMGNKGYLEITAARIAWGEGKKHNPRIVGWRYEPFI